ncbi:MAG: hypothetical protein U0T68_06080 [Ferruginibacter sp.]
MIKYLSGLLLGCLCFLTHASAQEKGVLAFTAARYSKEGINPRSIEVKVDGSYLLSNRVSLNKEIEIKLINPSGLTENNKTVYTGVELTYLSAAGAVLAQQPNMLKDLETRGISFASTRELSVKVPLKPEIIRADQSCTIKLRFYDLKGKGQLRVEMPVGIARPGEPLLVSKTINELKTSTPASAYAVGVKMKHVEISTDTTIRVNPKMAYASLDMAAIDGSTISEVLSGRESYWVYDENGNEIKMTDKQLKQVGGAMENSQVNYLSKVPFRLKTISGKTYFVRFRWESPDRRKLIDIVARL